MARRISTGTVGDPILGTLKTNENVITTVNDTNITLTPSGTGTVDSSADIRVLNEKVLKLYESGSTNFIGLKSPASVTSDLTYVLPGTDGSSGQALTTNGSGTLSWASVAVSVNNDAIDTIERNLTWTSATSGGITSVGVTSTKITFKPSDGTLRLKGGQASSSTTTGTLIVTGGIGASGAIYANSISATSITESSSIVLKENINPLINAVDTILNLEGVSYTRKSTGKTETGLIAEEVEKFAPELVSNDGEHKSIQYSRLTAYLVEAVKLLKQEIDMLKNR